VQWPVAICNGHGRESKKKNREKGFSILQLQTANLIAIAVAEMIKIN
jgi:hypothetical protein